MSRPNDKRLTFNATAEIYNAVRPPAPTRDRAEPEMRAVLEDDGRFDQVSVRRYDWNQRYSAAEYRKLMLSYSGTQMMDDTDRQGPARRHGSVHQQRL